MSKSVLIFETSTVKVIDKLADVCFGLIEKESDDEYHFVSVDETVLFEAKDLRAIADYLEWLNRDLKK